MIEPGYGWLQAHFKYSDHLNSPTLPGLENPWAVARAYEGLGLSFNTTTPDCGSDEAPENTLEMGSYSRGCEGALRGQGKPWL